jgi:hypothetical protein
MTTTSTHPSASHHLPAFITAPGQTDVLMVVMAIVLVLAVVMFGVLFFRLHTLPERIAHRTHKLQFEIVAILGLIALFTHMHIFWIAGLLLALVDFPDFGGWMTRTADALEKLAGVKSVDLLAGESTTRVEHPTPVNGPTAETMLAIKSADGGNAPNEPPSPRVKEEEHA